jgi:hypothetical protein
MKVLINSQLDKKLGNEFDGPTTFAGTLDYWNNQAYIYLDTFIPAKHLLIENPKRINFIQFKYVRHFEISDNIRIKGVFSVNNNIKIYEGAILLTPVI